MLGSIRVATACREAGIPRSLFYRLRKRYALYGPDLSRRFSDLTVPYCYDSSS
jgi:hypothetical protein